MSARIMTLVIAPHTVAERVPITPIDRLAVVPGHDKTLKCFVAFDGDGAKHAFCGIVRVSDRSELPQGTFYVVALTSGNGYEIPVKLTFKAGSGA